MELLGRVLTGQRERVKVLEYAAEVFVGDPFNVDLAAADWSPADTPTDALTNGPLQPVY